MFARKAGVLAALSATVLIAVGCGGSSTETAKDFKGAEAEVAEVITKLSTSMQERDVATICRTLLSPDTVTQIRKAQSGGCEKVLPSMLGPADTKLVVTDVTVTGDTAIASVKLADAEKGDDKASQMRLKKYQGVWKLQLV